MAKKLIKRQKLWLNGFVQGMAWASTNGYAEEIEKCAFPDEKAREIIAGAWAEICDMLPFQDQRGIEHGYLWPDFDEIETPAPNQKAKTKGAAD